MRLKSALVFLVALASFALYYFQAYLLNRADFPVLMLAVGVLFVCYEFLYKNLKTNLVKWGVALGILFRILTLFSAPNLSDDIFRFYWDGNLSVNSVSPFEEVPADNIGGANNQKLFDQLNSPNYFSVYPPVCQTVFFLAAKMFGEDYSSRLIVFKLFLLLCEIVSILLIVKLLGVFSLPPANVLLYALNPLAIIEIVGNVHFEGAMVTFVLLAIYLFIKDRWLWSAIALSLAVSTKLLPLIFLPFIWKKIEFPKFVIYSLIVLALSVIFFLPFTSFEHLPHLFESINLYFKKFEFNAGFYYVIRHIGFYTHGYNLLFTVGKYLSLATLISISLYAYLNRDAERSDLPKQFLFALAIYLFFASIVHPWYLVPLVAMSCFTRYRFAILWSFLVFLSYFAYSNPAYMESMKLIGLEYLVVIAYLIYELFFQKSDIQITE